MAGTPPPQLAARLVKPLIDRVEHLVATGVVADADLADAGVIFGPVLHPLPAGRSTIAWRKRRVLPQATLSGHRTLALAVHVGLPIDV